MEDINDIIQRKIWTAEQLLSQVEEIVEKSKSLLPNRREEISVNFKEWSEDKIRKHIETVRGAVISPIRHENKKKLKNTGVNIEKIPADIFDNTELIDKIATFFENIKNINNRLADILIRDRLIEGWLQDSPNEIEQRLQDIVNAESSLKEILEKEFDEKFKYELLKSTLEDVSFLEDAEEIMSNIEDLNSFGVLPDCIVEFEKFCEMLNKLSCKIRDILENYRISQEEIKQKIEGKILSKACEVIEQLGDECAEKKRKLLMEREIYASLMSFDEEIPKPPHTLPELEICVNEMRERCIKYLGDPGFRLLKFLRGEEEFPEGIEIKEIEKALKVFRFIFLKGLMEGGLNA